MNLKLIQNIAISLLLARWRQTLVAAIGVTFSITMFITLLSFMSGLNDLLDGLILNRTPHVRLYKEIKASDFQPIDLQSKKTKQYNFIRSIKPKSERLEIAMTNRDTGEQSTNSSPIFLFSPSHHHCCIVIFVRGLEPV